MAELRWNPMIKDWTMVASHRQNRPQMPKDWCPFCPGEDNPKVPKDYDVFMYPNDFPALSQTPPAMDHAYTDEAAALYGQRESYGKCEVILFSPDHHGTLWGLSREHIRKVVDLWCERFEEMSADEKIKYVFIFENRGDAVGVTMPHPHGQIYGFSVLPKKIELELDAAREFKQENGKCLFCAMNEEESRFGIAEGKNRVIYENDSFIAYVPYFADYAYGVYITAKAHKLYITDFDDAGKNDLADVLKVVTGAYDSLFDNRFPYMMCMHNGPVNCCGDYPDLRDFYHFHIEFYPPMRSETKQQFMASSETGVWAHCNPTAPEEKAAELRAAVEKFIKSGK